jgi:hypothetical protein
MPQIPTSRIDPDVQPTPPESDPSVVMYRWALKRFTAPEWSVQAVAFERNQHLADLDATVLEGTLTHESGALVQIHPLDTQDHTPSKETQPRYTRHRIRLRTDEDTAHYVTISPNGLSERLAPSTLSTQLVESVLPEKDAVTLHPQSVVHEATTDETPYSMRSKIDALLTVYGTAHHITTKTNEQTGLNEFC